MHIVLHILIEKIISRIISVKLRDEDRQWVPHKVCYLNKLDKNAVIRRGSPTCQTLQKSLADSLLNLSVIFLSGAIINLLKYYES